MRFKQSDIRKISALAGIGEKAVERLLGSVRIELSKAQQIDPFKLAEPVKEIFELGLRLSVPEVLVILTDRWTLEQLIERLGTVLREYAALAPLIVGWVGRGDFDRTKLPEQLSRTKLKHGSITAGRLRAAVLRS